jgi:protein NrfD
MAWFYLAYFVVLCLLLWLAVMRRHEGGAVRVLAWVGIPLALIFGGGEGALFGVVGARPFWNSGMTPILFIVEGLVSGVALVAFAGLILRGMDETVTTTLGRLVLGLLVLSILFEWAEFSIGSYASIPAYADSQRLVLFGQFSWVFWGVHVGLGMVLPLVLLAAAGRNRGAVAVATALIAFTAISTKLNVVIPGLAVPELEGLRDAYVGPGLSFQYFPTTMEWLVALWIVASAGLVFLLCYRVLARPSAAAEHRAGAGPALQH